jgi:hypothetical protein
MRGTWWHRALSAVMAVWFGLFVAEPAWLHACAVHSPGAAADHARAPEPAARASHCADSVADAAPRDSAPGHHVPASDGTSHRCTCPGACCAVSAPALPAVTVQPVLDALVAAVDRGRPQHEYVAAWVDLGLPFATAPPSPAVLA